MVRAIVALLTLGLAAIAWVILLPDASRKQPAAVSASPTPAPALDTVQTARGGTNAGRDVRVVYAGPEIGAPVRKLTDKVDVPPAAPVASPAPATDATVASTEATTVVTPAPAAPTAMNSAAQPAPMLVPAPSAGSAVNINTATVDTLNQIPGAGRIGRTIASHRPYASIDELVSKRVIRKSVYDKIKDQIAAN